jgi:hypothetical protein
MHAVLFVRAPQLLDYGATLCKRLEYFWHATMMNDQQQRFIAAADLDVFPHRSFGSPREKSIITSRQ